MHVLYIEDYALDAELVRVALLRRAPDIRLDIVSTVEEAITRLNRFELVYGGDQVSGASRDDPLTLYGSNPRYDLVLTDLSLPDGSGLDILAHVRKRSLMLAVVILTGSGQEDTVYAALQSGADDYVTKQGDYLASLPAMLHAALEHFQGESARLARTLRVLYAEPNAADADLTMRQLAQRAPHLHLEVVQSAGEVLAHLSSLQADGAMVDVLLLDYRLPGMTAIDLVKELHQIRGMDLPIVLVTGHGNTDVARLALRLGVHEYIVKTGGYLERLPFALENAYYRAASLRKQLALTKSEREFRSLADNMPEPVARFDREYRYLYVNAAVQKLIGKPASVLLGATNAEFDTQPDGGAAMVTLMQQVFDTGSIEKSNVSYFHPDGREDVFQALVVPELNSSGEVETVLVLAHDITERLQYEQTLRERGRQLQTMIDHFPGIASHVDANLRYLNVNAALEKVVGLSKEQLLLRTIPEVLPPKRFAGSESRIRRVLAGETISLEIDFINRHGKQEFALLTLVPDTADDGTVKGFFHTQIDITDLKQTQLALLKRETELRLVADQFPGILSRLDRDLRIVFANAQHEKLYGCTLDQIVGRTIMELSGERFAPIEHYYRRALAGQATTYEAKRFSDAGETMYWFVTLVPDVAPDQTVQGILVSALDITERREAELAVQAREQELSVITNQFPGTIARLDLDLRYLYVNDQVTEIYQRPREEILGRTMLEIVGPERFARVEAPLQKVLAGERQVFNLTLNDPSGDERHVILNLIPDFADDGSVRGLFNIILDVTDTRRAELAVRAREQELSVITSQFPGVIARLDRDLRYQFVNDAFAETFKRPAQEIVGRTHPDLLGPELFAKSEKEFRQALAGEAQTFNRSYRYASGEVRHFINNLVPDIAADGTVQGLFIIGLDVTATRKAELESVERERHLTIISDNFPGVISRLDRDFRILFANSHHSQEFGKPQEIIVGKTVPELIGRERFKGIEHYYQAALRGERVSYENSSGAPGDIKDWIVNLVPDVAADQTVQGMFVSAIDISEHKKQERRIERLSSIHVMHSEINSAVVRIHDRQPLLQEVCRIIVAQTGLGMAWVALLDEKTNELNTVAWWGAFDPTLIKNYRVPIYGKKNKQYGVAARAVLTGKAVVIDNIQSDPQIGYLRQEAIRNNYKSAIGLPLMSNDKAIGALVLYAAESHFFSADEVRLLEDLVTDIAVGLDYLAKTEHINHLAYYDRLTDLPNRVSLVNRLEATNKKNSRLVALIDIARFRLINDSFGRDAGDEIIKLVAERLRGSGLAVANTARIESNCFGIQLDAEDETQGSDDLENLLHTLFGSPFRLAGNEFHIKAKCGAALILPGPVFNAELAIRHAELALIAAKQSVENVLFYRPRMDERSSEALNLETRLRRALANHEFILHYQPKLDLRDQRVTSVEALIRWQDAETGQLVPPGLFIPLLEKTGMIFDVGRWVLRQAAIDYERWQNMGIRAPRVAVNVSALQLGHHRFVDVLQSVVAGRTAHSHGIDLEITESVIMTNLDENIAKLEAARALGMNIAIDDFGTGYSSLSYLSKLPVNTLKIDRSFVIEMTTGEAGRLLVASIINLAHTLKLKVVAEGVETQEQLDILSGFGCDQIQGYFICKPIPTAALEAWLVKQDAPTFAK